MNKRAEQAEILKDNVVYIILYLVFFLGMFFYVKNTSNGANVWGEIYAKEMAKIINLAEPEEEYYINIQEISEIAIKNDVSFEKIFQFDNKKSEVCVQLSKTKKNCYLFFNDVIIKENEVILGVPENYVKFKIEKRKNE